MHLFVFFVENEEKRPSVWHNGYVTRGNAPARGTGATLLYSVTSQKNGSTTFTVTGAPRRPLGKRADDGAECSGTPRRTFGQPISHLEIRIVPNTRTKNARPTTEQRVSEHKIQLDLGRPVDSAF